MLILDLSIVVKDFVRCSNATLDCDCNRVVAESSISWNNNIEKLFSSKQKQYGTFTQEVMNDHLYIPMEASMAVRRKKIDRHVAIDLYSSDEKNTVKTFFLNFGRKTQIRIV